MHVGLFPTLPLFPLNSQGVLPPITKKFSILIHVYARLLPGHGNMPLIPEIYIYWFEVVIIDKYLTKILNLILEIYH